MSNAWKWNLAPSPVAPHRCCCCFFSISKNFLFSAPTVHLPLDKTQWPRRGASSLRVVSALLPSRISVAVSPNKWLCFDMLAWPVFVQRSDNLEKIGISVYRRRCWLNLEIVTAAYLNDALKECFAFQKGPNRALPCRILVCFERWSFSSLRQKKILRSLSFADWIWKRSSEPHVCLNRFRMLLIKRQVSVLVKAIFSRTDVSNWIPAWSDLGRSHGILPSVRNKR